MALNKIKLSLNILSFVERNSLFHTVGYKNHSVGISQYETENL